MSQTQTARFRYLRKVYDVPISIAGDPIAESVEVVGSPERVSFDRSPASGDAAIENTDNKTGCSSCKKKKKKRTLTDTLRGATKLVKSELGIGSAADSMVETRKALCLSCGFQDLGVCSKCGCYCAAKIKLKNEKCPIGKWGDADGN